MGTFFLDISVSLDGYVAGPNQTVDEPLGAGGERLHEWIIATKAWREIHGYEGGNEGIDSEISQAVADGVGATIMGRKMFSGGSGPWESDPKADAWWGDDPPFHNPVFVLTHHARETVPKQGGTTYVFVTDGIESALEQAGAAAGDKRILLAGGAQAAQQYLKAKLLDEVHLHVVPLFLGGGERLFEVTTPGELQRVSVAESPTGVTHLKYRVVK
jgi:dihydrofolate reductase